MQQWTAALLPQREALVWRLAANLFFDGVEGADLIEDSFCQSRLVQFVQIDELASHIRPAGGFKDAPAIVQFRKTGIAVGAECR